METMQHRKSCTSGWKAGKETAHQQRAGPIHVRTWQRQPQPVSRECWGHTEHQIHHLFRIGGYHGENLRNPATLCALVPDNLLFHQLRKIDGGYPDTTHSWFQEGLKRITLRWSKHIKLKEYHVNLCDIHTLVPETMSTSLVVTDRENFVLKNYLIEF